MFIHAPEKSQIAVSTLVLWDDPDLACRAVAICREIERRLEQVAFEIEEADAADLEWKGQELRAKACAADLVLVALQRTLCEQPGFVRAWFLDWSQARRRRAGALAVLRPADRLSPEQFRRAVRELGRRFPDCPEPERKFRQFLADCARRARMELYWGCLESKLEEATREMRIFEAPDPHYSPELMPAFA